MKRCLDLGVFSATARAARTGTFARGEDPGDDAEREGRYAEVDVVLLSLDTPPEEPASNAACSIPGRCSAEHPCARHDVDLHRRLQDLYGRGLFSAGDLGGRVVRWRGGYSDAAVQRTIRSLIVMGATMPDDDPTDLAGVGSRPFLARVVAVECDVEETHGSAGVWRLFVREVTPLSTDLRPASGAAS